LSVATIQAACETHLERRPAQSFQLLLAIGVYVTKTVTNLHKPKMILCWAVLTLITSSRV
jgi:hypothetical protein